jgi:16S rRNA (cytosine1402-N4)-methyltransferase
MKRASRHRQIGDPQDPDPLRYGTAYHVPVLCKAVVEGLVTDRHGVYIDATLGGGGHSAALLDALDPAGRVVGIDQDADALHAAQTRLAAAQAHGRFRVVQGNFGDLARLLDAIGLSQIDGLLLDLGVSSHQLAVAERGFSHQAEGPLDMRMDARSGVSASDLVNHATEADLQQVLRAYGEEPRAAALARAIRAARPLETTGALAQVVRRVVPPPDQVKALSRVFQALRIVVNRELEVLEQALMAAVVLVRPGGRIAVISYHSLEDRRVKHFLRYGNFAGQPVRNLYGHLQTPWREQRRRPVEASAEEVAANPRARSARLRIAERLPNLPEPTP